MNPAGALLGILVAVGIILVLTGIQSRPDTTAAAPARRRRLGRLALARHEQLILAVCATVGIVAALTTGWVVLVLLLPLLGVGLPRLLSGYSDPGRVQLLDDLEQWTRALASVLGAHGSLQSALASTLKTCPEGIRPATERLVTRLQVGQPPQWAVREWVDEIDDTTADLIGATLLLSMRATDRKLRTILTDLADQVAAQVRSRRQIETDRGGPLREARLVTLISTALLTGFIFGTSPGRTYLHGSGLLALAVVTAAFGGCLIALKRATRIEPTPRFMQARTLEESTR